MDKRNVMIEVTDINKTFRIPHERNTSLKQAAIGLLRKKSYTKFHVLKGITFNVYEGEFFGIVGRNGCGKSTLLKILSGIYMVDSGSMKINGKISPFLELGVGFNPELSGKENVFLNGAILGLSKKEIADKYDDIVNFSELHDFMDQKLKNYSSGMQVRLAFSVAINAHAPIILLDEVLAVGDASFQKKCNDVFLKLKEEGRTIILVTHNMDAVKEYCDRAIFIVDGKIVNEGNPKIVADEYLAKSSECGSTEIKNDNNAFLVKDIKINGKDKNINLLYGEDINLSGVLEYKGKPKASIFHLAIQDNNNETVIFTASGKQKEYTIGGKTTFGVKINRNIAPGSYHIALSVHNPKSGESYYGNTNIIGFNILSSDDESGETQKIVWE